MEKKIMFGIISVLFLAFVGFLIWFFIIVNKSNNIKSLILNTNDKLNEKIDLMINDNFWSSLKSTRTAA